MHLNLYNVQTRWGTPPATLSYQLERSKNMEEKDALVEQKVEDQPVDAPSGSDESMETLLEQEGLGIDFPRVGEVRTGMIASIGDSEILVSVGAKSEGIISGREFDQIEPELRAELKVGQEIPVYVLSLEDKNGILVLSYNRAREELDWEVAEELLESEGNYETEIMGFNKGGLLVPIGLLRGFVPSSQVSLVRRMNTSGDTPEQRWGKMVGEPITVQVIEVDRDRRRLILSERAALNETRESLKDRLLDELQEGDVRKGRVTSLADFGAFVNIQGADGLVHLSEISWERIKHPSEVLKIGEKVDVKVISIDQEKKRIGLSIRQLLPDPWQEKVGHLKEGQLIEGTITHLTKFGAFARLDDDELEGLIHISELSEKRIAHPKEIVSEGDVLTLRVIKLDLDRRRIGLSLRKVDSAAYADLDWKILREELSASEDEEITEETPSEETEALEVVDQPAETESTGEETLPEDGDEQEVTAEEESISDEPPEEPDPEEA
jgi:small subunit ribosomal protein S1